MTRQRLPGYHASAVFARLLGDDCWAMGFGLTADCMLNTLHFPETQPFEYEFVAFLKQANYSGRVQMPFFLRVLKADKVSYGGDEVVCSRSH